jgi:phthalate 4,5-cis-dihydrodiol dehydrogenase
VKKIENPLRVAVVGVHFGAYIVRQLKANPHLRCLWACDAIEERAHGVGEENDVPWTTSYEEVLADKEVEAVLLYTPPHLHAEHIKMAARAGKAIRVTKPLERSSKAATEALELAEELGTLVIADSPPPRYTGLYALIGDLRVSGELGEIVSANTWTGSFYDNVHPDGTWYDDNDLCPGGPIYRLGIYGINMFNVLLGKPREVTASQSWLRSTRPTPDTGSVTIVYENNAVVNIINSLSWGGTSYPDTTVVFGTKGMLIANPYFAGIGGEDRRIMFRTRDEVNDIFEFQLNDISDDEYFISLVREGVRPEIPLSHGVDSVRVIEAVHKSLTEGRTVQLEETCST